MKDANGMDKEPCLPDLLEWISDTQKEGSPGQEEIEDLKEKLPEYWGLVEAECEENAEVMFNLYQTLRKARNWSDETLCNELRIDGKALEDIRNLRKPESEGVGLKLLYELFPHMAI